MISRGQRIGLFRKRRAAVSSAFDPSPYGTAAFIFDAATGNVNKSGGSNAANGDSITQWNNTGSTGVAVTDDTGNSHSLPVYRTSTGLPNGKPYVEFATTGALRGSSAVMSVASLAGYTMFFVARSSGDDLLLYDDTNNRQIRIGESGTNTISQYDLRAVSSSSLTQSRSSWNVYTYGRASMATNDGGNFSFYENGNAKGTGGAYGSACAFNRIGGLSGTIDLAYAVGFPGLLSGANITALCNDLKTFFGTP